MRSNLIMGCISCCLVAAGANISAAQEFRFITVGGDALGAYVAGLQGEIKGEIFIDSQNRIGFISCDGSTQVYDLEQVLRADTNCSDQDVAWPGTVYDALQLPENRPGNPVRIVRAVKSRRGCLICTTRPDDIQSISGIYELDGGIDWNQLQIPTRDWSDVLRQRDFQIPTPLSPNAATGAGGWTGGGGAAAGGN